MLKPPVIKKEHDYFFLISKKERDYENTRLSEQVKSTNFFFHFQSLINIIVKAQTIKPFANAGYKCQSEKRNIALNNFQSSTIADSFGNIC